MEPFESPLHFILHHYGRAGDLELIMVAAQRTETALRDLQADRIAEARVQWSSVEGEALLDAWDNVTRRIAEVGPRWDPQRPRPTGPVGTKVTPSVARRIYERDRYRCRYCQMPIFTRTKGSPLRGLIRAFPDLTPNLTLADDSLTGTGIGGAIRNVDYAKFLWSLAAPDHIHPRSLGGNATPENLVSSCSGCNYAKGDLTLGQMGVRSPLPLDLLP